MEVIHVLNCVLIPSSIHISSCYLQASEEMMVGIVVTSFSQSSNSQKSNILCRHTVAILRPYGYNQHSLLHGRILLVYSWSLGILTELFNIIRYTWPCSHYPFFIFHLVLLLGLS